MHLSGVRSGGGVIPELWSCLPLSSQSLCIILIAYDDDKINEQRTLRVGYQLGLSHCLTSV